MTRHHLVPRKEVRRGRADAGDVPLLWICRSCHNQLHKILTHREMADMYNSLESLLTHPDVARYVAWVRKRKPRGKIKVR